jgi:hypothetical protein
MIRADPGDIYDGMGWGVHTVKNDRDENEYVAWGRKEVLATDLSGPDSSLSQPEVLRPRIADRMYPY